MDKLLDMDLVEVADQGRDPRGRIAAARRDWPARSFSSPALLIGQELRDHIRMRQHVGRIFEVRELLDLGRQAERRGLHFDHLAEAVEPAGRVERKGVITSAVGLDEPGIHGASPGANQGWEAKVLVRQVGTGRLARPGRGGGVERLGEVGPAQAEEHGQRERRPVHSRCRPARILEWRDGFAVLRRFPGHRFDRYEFAEFWRLAARPQRDRQCPDVGVQVRLRADGEHLAAPRRSRRWRTAGFARPLRRDELSGLPRDRSVEAGFLDLNLPVVAAARVADPRLEQRGGRLDEGPRELRRRRRPRCA